MLVLGIETTCDETAAAVVRRDEDGRGEILSNIVLSQTDEHAPYGGVVPEIAARAHVEVLDTIIARAMIEANAALRLARRRRGGGRPRPDRRRHRRAHHREGDRAGRREAADRGQSSRSARADRAAHRRHGVSLLPVPRLGRAHADRRGARCRQIRAARHHARRCDRRSLRQDREAARPRLSGRPGGRARGEARRSRALHPAAPDARPRRSRLLALRAEDRAAHGGREGRAA